MTEFTDNIFGIKRKRCKGSLFYSACPSVCIQLSVTIQKQPGTKCLNAKCYKMGP
jgi:hypothetical protein